MRLRQALNEKKKLHVEEWNKLRFTIRNQLILFRKLRKV